MCPIDICFFVLILFKMYVYRIPIIKGMTLIKQSFLDIHQNIYGAIGALTCFDLTFSWVDDLPTVGESFAIQWYGRVLTIPKALVQQMATSNFCSYTHVTCHIAPPAWRITWKITTSPWLQPLLQCWPCERGHSPERTAFSCLAPADVELVVPFYPQHHHLSPPSSRFLLLISVI